MEKNPFCQNGMISNPINAEQGELLAHLCNNKKLPINLPASARLKLASGREHICDADGSLQRRRVQYLVNRQLEVFKRFHFYLQRLATATPVPLDSTFLFYVLLDLPALTGRPL